MKSRSSKSQIKKRLAGRVALPFLVLALAGCGHNEDEHAHARETGEHAEKAAGVTFSEKRGLKVPAETAKFIGLQVAEVEERKVVPSFHFQAQVFRAASEAQFASTQPAVGSTAFATGVLSTNEAGRFQPGTEVTVHGPRGKTLGGRISEVHATGGSMNGHVETIVAVQDPDAVLKRGETIKPTVSGGAEKTVTAVPRSALLKAAEGNFVYTVSGEHYVRTPVKVGDVNEHFAEVTDGLLSGDQIVVKPVMTLWLAELQAIRGGKACADGH